METYANYDEIVNILQIYCQIFTISSFLVENCANMQSKANIELLL